MAETLRFEARERRRWAKQARRHAQVEAWSKRTAKEEDMPRLGRTNMEAKPLEDLSERELQQRLNRATKRFQELDAIPAAEVVREGKTAETLRAIDATYTAIAEMQTELSRRAKERRGAEIRDRMEAAPRFKEMEKRRGRNRHPASGAAFNYVRKRAHLELQGVILDWKRLTKEEGGRSSPRS
jgi:hypothetical protein